MGNIFTVDLGPFIVCCVNCSRERAEKIYQLEENLSTLKFAKEELEEIKKDLQKTISEEMLQDLLQSRIARWIEKAEKKTLEADDLTKDGKREVGKLCCGGHCSKHLKQSYKFGKNVSKKIGEVGELNKEGKEFVDSLLAKRPGDGVMYVFDQLYLCCLDKQEEEPRKPIHELCETEEEELETLAGEEDEPQTPTAAEGEGGEKPVEVVAMYGGWCVIFMCVVLLLVSVSCVNIR
ncbi:hypothetical protein MANES_13G055000v8 [Manihot esculenta]|uniref:Uncharacterized protein n=1 Tax=Manihot esculenta TaxID=3983 RepID=A0A2C9UPA6_MANES|nr:hypothetical protein MANES_13G055000v8 [Manihot esculenta]